MTIYYVEELFCQGRKLMPPKKQGIGKMHQEVNGSEEAVKAGIRTKVLSRLGKPLNLKSIDCVNVFDNKWRINVWCEETLPGRVATTYIIQHSFFCKMTKGGTLRCNPKIERVYRPSDNQPKTNMGHNPTADKQ